LVDAAGARDDALRVMIAGSHPITASRRAVARDWRPPA
jgi:hypothetical protein